MEKQLSPEQAFDDFLIWVHDSGIWSTLDKKERNRIITARRDRKEKRGDFRLGHRRIKSLLTKYAPDRYEFREAVIIHEK